MTQDSTMTKIPDFTDFTEKELREYIKDHPEFLGDRLVLAFDASKPGWRGKKTSRSFLPKEQVLVL